MGALISGSVNPFTDMAPHYILFGFDERLPYDVLLQHPLLLYTLEDYSKTLLLFSDHPCLVHEQLQAPREMLSKQQSKSTTDQQCW